MQSVCSMKPQPGFRLSRSYCANIAKGFRMEIRKCLPSGFGANTLLIALSPSTWNFKGSYGEFAARAKALPELQLSPLIKRRR